MSSNTKTAHPKGGRASKSENKSHHITDKTDGKGTDKHGTNTNTKSEEYTMKEKVRTLIEMSQRSEEEVCLALHDCDNDANLAINMLLEDMVHGEWETRVKKRKNRQSSASKQEKVEDEQDSWEECVPPVSNDKEKPKNNRGGNNSSTSSRGWRGRERQENERNLEGGRRPSSNYRQMGPGRGGGGGGRGRGGGRAGSRYPPRGNRSSSNYNKEPIDTWDNSHSWNNTTADPAANHTECWDDFPGTDEWSTEEYTGSLADTKVFTPSVQTAGDGTPPAEATVNAGDTITPVDTAVINQQSNTQITSSAGHISGTLSAAQTQYLTQLTQQNSENSNQYSNSGNNVQYQTQNSTTATVNPVFSATQSSQQQTFGSTSVQQNQYVTSSVANPYISTNYSNANNSFAQEQQQKHAQSTVQAHGRPKTQRARVPPPSKIPSSAVEMPGDLNSSSIGYLDVQFGAMDFMSDSSVFEANTVGDTKYSTGSGGTTTKAVNTVGNLESSSQQNSTVDLNVSTNKNSSAFDAYTVKNTVQSSITSALSQNLINTGSLPHNTDHLTTNYSGGISRNTASNPGVVSSSASSTGLDISKSNEYSQSSTYNSYQTKPSNYSAPAYTGSTQVTSSAYVSNQSSSHYGTRNQTSGYSSSSVNTYPNAYSSGSAYQTNSSSNNSTNNTNSVTFSSISQANPSYQSSTSNQSYQTNPSNQSSVYGSGLNSTSTYSSNQSSNQYNTYSTTRPKDTSVYESTSSTGVNTGNVTNNTSIQPSASTVTSSNTTNPTGSSTSSSSLSHSSGPKSASNQSVSSNTISSKTSSTSTNSNIVSNIPPGVTPTVMGPPYIMGQVPYFQPPVYSYEDMQLLQQRLPHMATSYYDMSYQTPTTLATVRDAALGNVGYSLSDGRYARGDNNASPVPSTLSQQSSTLTQGHQAQPILAAGTAGPQYFFPAAAFNTLAPNYQFGTMYTQMPAATNTHGSSNSNQYPKATYNSGYGSYDALSQSQDYSKSGYVGSSQSQKGSNMNSTGSSSSNANDLSAMYSKSHATLGKVNSYDKQGFHSGTPPPYTGTIHGAQSSGLAPSGTSYPPQVYISAMTPHQQQLSTHLMQQPLHQMDVRHQNRRMDATNTNSQRSQTGNASKNTGGKQSYPTSYWNQA